MRLVACGLFGTVILILVANALAGVATPAASVLIADTGIPSELAPQILQGGALGVLALTLWYMLTRTFPAHTAALKEQRESFLSFLQAERQELSRERTEGREFIRLLVDK